MALAIVNRPTPIEYGKFRCLIMDAPNDTNAPSYLKILSRYGVTEIVRTCESTYSAEYFREHQIEVQDMVFPDGEPPPDEVIQGWLEIIDRVLYRKNSSNSSDLAPSVAKPAVAVHCLAGLGRAPVLVAIALIEKEGVEPLDAVLMIRERRKGAINARQLKFLESYKARRGHNNCCTIS